MELDDGGLALSLHGHDVAVDLQVAVDQGLDVGCLEHGVGVDLAAGFPGVLEELHGAGAVVRLDVEDVVADDEQGRGLVEINVAPRSSHGADAD